jgi:hypothetical protein
MHSIKRSINSSDVIIFDKIINEDKRNAGYNLGDILNMPALSDDWTLNMPPHLLERMELIANNYEKSILWYYFINRNQSDNIVPDIPLLKESVQSYVKDNNNNLSHVIQLVKKHNCICVHVRSGDIDCDKDYINYIIKMSYRFEKVILLSGIHLDEHFKTKEAKIANFLTTINTILKQNNNIYIYLGTADAHLGVMMNASNLLLHQGGFSCLGSIVSTGNLFLTRYFGYDKKDTWKKLVNKPYSNDIEDKELSNINNKIQNTFKYIDSTNNKMDFDYKYYLENYPDLRHLNKEQALEHWHKHGIKEGRTCKKAAINNETNITIIVHLFHGKLLDEFLGYIINVKSVFNKVNVIFTIRQNSEIATKIKAADSTFVVIPVENKGVDVYAFIVALEYMRKHFVTDFVLKLHSKITNNPTENNIEWRKQLIKPITDYNNLLILQHYFKNLKHIGYVAAQSCVFPKNYDLDFPQNINGVVEICIKFPHLEKEWADFVGGNMFWISNDTLNQLNTDLCEYITKNVSSGKPPCNLGNPNISIEYVCERLFTGVLCYDKTNILVNEFVNTQRSVSSVDGKIDNSYFYSPRVFSIHQPKNVILN